MERLCSRPLQEHDICLLCGCERQRRTGADHQRFQHQAKLPDPGNLVDANDDIYVSNEGNDEIPASVTVYAAGVNGNVAPILKHYWGVKRGCLPQAASRWIMSATYSSPNRSDEVTVYAKRANGNVAPTKTIASELY